ncbi:hypothetical protein B0H14DRAFT_2621050 [Mycena olivaceomarginata]|nr:hypothetical protein B0H14DRAFT_2621050 [Mycena olivaceomarginata]
MVDTTFAVIHGITNERKLLVWLNGLDRCTVIGRVWSNRATREAFVLVWNGIFEAIQTITAKSPSLLGVLGDSEGAQAQALGDVIILRRLNLKAVDGVATVDVDPILMFVWKTCLVYFKCLEFQYLLSFPYLETDADIQEYYTFCGESQNTKLKGSHAHDNQVNKTNATLLEAILSAQEFDGENTRIIKASLESGIWENGNNSLHARFSSQAARHARSRQKKAEINSDPATKGLRSRLKATEKSSKEKDLEIQRLNARLNDLFRPVASSSRTQIESFTPSHTWLLRNGAAGPNHQSTPQSHEIIDLDSSPPRTASPMKALNLFPGSRHMTPIAEHRSDFDYAAALNSDVLDYTLNTIVEEHPKYPINGDDEVLESDSYPTPLSHIIQDVGIVRGTPASDGFPSGPNPDAPDAPDASGTSPDGFPPGAPDTSAPFYPTAKPPGTYVRSRWHVLYQLVYKVSPSVGILILSSLRIPPLVSAPCAELKVALTEQDEEVKAGSGGREDGFLFREEDFLFGGNSVRHGYRVYPRVWVTRVRVRVRVGNFQPAPIPCTQPVNPRVSTGFGTVNFE